MSSKKNNNWALLADLTPSGYEVNEKSHFLPKNPKIKPFVVKSLLEPKCKRFRNSAIRENFDLEPETQLKKNSIQEPKQLYSIIQRDKKEPVSHFLPLYQNKF